MQEDEDIEVQIVYLTKEEIEEKMMKIIERHKGYDTVRHYLVREIHQELRRQGILVSEEYIYKFLRKLIKNGLIIENGSFYKIL